MLASGSGADDYVTKPFQPEELRARVRIGRRVLELQVELAEQRAVLHESMMRERLLQRQMQISAGEINSDGGQSGFRLKLRRARATSGVLSFPQAATAEIRGCM